MVAVALASDTTAALFREATSGMDLSGVQLIPQRARDVMAAADWIVDLGPDGGRHGGELIFEGTPDALCAVEHSHTGRALGQALGARG